MEKNGNYILRFDDAHPYTKENPINEENVVLGTDIKFMQDIVDNIFTNKLKSFIFIQNGCYYEFSTSEDGQYMYIYIREEGTENSYITWGLNQVQSYILFKMKLPPEDKNKD